MGPLEVTTILHLIEAHRAEALDILKSLSAILYDRNEALLFQYVHAFLQRQGLTTRFLSSYPPLLYGEVYHETTPTLLFYLNYDCEAYISIQAQTIAANLISLLIYQTILATQDGISPITLKWLLGQKNFSHTLQFQYIIEQLPAFHQVDACLWYEPVLTERAIDDNADKLILATGTKGYLSVELQVQTACTSIHSSYGAIAPNAAWRMLWALNSLKDQREEILIEGFYDTMTPLEDEALQQLANLPDRAATQAAHWGMPDLLMGLQGKQMHYAHILTPTCTINRLISAEDALPSVPARPLRASIPATATAIVDFYLVPGQDPADIFDKLKRHLRVHGFSDIHVKRRYASSAVYTPAHNHFVQQVVHAAKQVYGQSPVILPLLPEHVPIQPFARNLSTPTVIFPLYTQEKHAEDNFQSLCNTIAQFIQIILCHAP